MFYGRKWDLVAEKPETEQEKRTFDEQFLAKSDIIDRNFKLKDIFNHSV